MGYPGVLHTNTNYVASHSYPNTHDWDTFAIGYLIGQENKLYATLGQSSFSGFMNEIHRLLDEAGDVRNILRNFQKANLVASLGLPQTLTFTNQEIRINLTGAQNISFKKLFAPLAYIPGFQVDIPNDNLTFTYNEATIKTLMNYLENRNDRDKFRITGGSNLTKATSAFKEWLINHNIIEVEINGTPKNITATSKISDKASNFSLTQKDIDEAIKDVTLRQTIIDARREVYNMLFNLCNGSADLQKAFREVWTRKMGNITSTHPETLKQFIFLSKGGNLEKGVAGAVQEMYGALLAEYLGLLRKKSLPKGLVEIMGNIAEGGEQPKADLVILDQIGIQVKAYGMSNKIKHMESNLHPNALDAQLNPYGALNVGDAIVQSVFNTDNESPASIANDLRDFAAALLNLSTSKDLKVTSTVCFYLIDAQYLVPGSEILKAFDEQQSDYKVRITSSFQGKSSAEYRRLTYETQDSPDNESYKGFRISPGFIEYFDKEGKAQIHPDENNMKWYNLLYTSRISIRTVFDYGFANNNIYSIF